MGVWIWVSRFVSVLLRAPGLRFSRQKGQGMVEYALILVLVSIVVIVLLVTMARAIGSVYSDVVLGLSA